MGDYLLLMLYPAGDISMLFAYLDCLAKNNPLDSRGRPRTDIGHNDDFTHFIDLLRAVARPNVGLMKLQKVYILSALAFFSILLTSCVVITGLDPAEKLAHRLESKSRDLKRSKATTIAFDFTPDEKKVRDSPRFDGDVSIRVYLKRQDENRSGIRVGEWFRTTYHNRFLHVPNTLKQTKMPGEAFRIVLTKSGDKILWTELK